MRKNTALVLFAAFALLLEFLVWLRTGSILPPSGNDAIWFNAGLFALLVGSFITEYRFTKPNDVFVNCIVVFASIATLSDPPHSSWWAVLKWGALVGGISAVVIAWDPGVEVRFTHNRWRNALYQLIVRLGSARVIFSFVFVLALISYFDFDKLETKVFAAIWGIFLVTAYLDFPSLFKLTFRRSHGRTLLATTHSFLAPSIVFCRKMGASSAKLYDFVGFCDGPNAECHSYGLVIGERVSASENRVAVALLGSTIDDNLLSANSLLVTLSENDLAGLDSHISPEAVAAAKHIVGTVAKSSTISQLRVEVFGAPKIAAGSLLSVVTREQRKVYYQIFNGLIEEEATQESSSRAFVEGLAEQVGCWETDRGGFESHDWVAGERSSVHLLDEVDPPPQYALKERELTIGAIPNSNFPVNIDLSDLVLFHSAILGVTGSGKTFLTFKLLEECAAKGIKIVCIDPSGDYQKYLATAVMLSQNGACLAFLNSPSDWIGIIETSAKPNIHPITQALAAAKICIKWCRENRTDEEVISPKPKILFVMEEAHLLAPEWNFNPDKTLQNQVSEISQTVLQARKYGLGFLIVTQRTANVVKSILNQCNTIFSFQAFDETGFDFLKNYMGSFHVQALPTLKLRHGIVVGKASRSRRPILVRFTEQARNIRASPAPEMVVVVPPVVPIGPAVQPL